MKRKKAKHIDTNWQILDKTVPVRLFFEWRGSRRVSIGKKSVIARFPVSGKYSGHSEQETWAKTWLTEQLRRKPSLFDHLQHRSYQDGQSIKTTNKQYYIRLLKENRKTGKARCEGENLNIVIPEDLDTSQEAHMIQMLLGQALSSDNLSWVSTRINEINNYYRLGKIKSVRIKNNRSNWGSCSSSGNINISTRLLFAPNVVQDYIFVHELVHLREMNHSERFWDVVKDIMPNYAKKERWLRERGHLCYF